MRIAILWTRLSGYLNVCLRELASRREVEVLVAHEVAGGDAPFDEKQFSWMPHRIEYVTRPDRVRLLDEVQRFEPDILLVNSWHIGEFRFVLDRLRPVPVRVLCMDNQWRGTLKQRLGVAGSRWYVRPHYDAVFLPGERQACFARRLGFREDQIWTGLLCPDSDSLSSIESTNVPSPRAFGYLGRLTAEKGLQDLMESYELYRSAVPDPWGLVVAGAGPLHNALRRHPTVRHEGFVQPAALAAWFAEIGCLIVPSRFEPWGVVIAEAAAAGLPIIATEACGAVPHLVHDFANGRVARTGDARSIARCMEFVAGIGDSARTAMGQISRGLASPYTAARWADTIIERSGELIAGRSPR